MYAGYRGKLRGSNIPEECAKWLAANRVTAKWLAAKWVIRLSHCQWK